MRRLEQGLSVAAGLIVAGLIFAGGFYIGHSQKTVSPALCNITNKDLGQPGNVDFAPFWQAWQTINDKYVDGNNSSTTPTASKVENEKRVWGAISGLVASLGDPYSVFFPPEEKKNFDDEIRGDFGGIGTEIGVRNNTLTVISALPNTPAKAAGIKTGDQIIAIDGKLTSQLSVDESVKAIRGEVGTKVKLSITRASTTAPFDVTLVRAVINIPTIKTLARPDGVFVISLYNFSAQSADVFRQALREFAVSGDRNLVIDLRGNPGGYLEAAVDMASWFLPTGQPVVREQHEGGAENVYRSRGYDVFNDKLRLAILVDGGSASAAEILAGALSEYKIGTLIGTKTFGKGSVQELIPLTNDTSLKLTVARWLTPQGHSISHEGLEPKIKVDITADQVKKGEDPQLERAAQFLLTGK